MSVIYEEYTNTIRKVPQNYCLICWDQNGIAIFNLDGATKDYRNKVKIAYLNWLSLETEDKNLLAELVAEQIIK